MEDENQHNQTVQEAQVDLVDQVAMIKEATHNNNRIEETRKLEEWENKLILTSLLV